MAKIVVTTNDDTQVAYFPIPSDCNWMVHAVDIYRAVTRARQGDAWEEFLASEDL